MAPLCQVSYGDVSWSGRTRTFVASPGSKPGGPCQQSNRPMRAAYPSRTGRLPFTRGPLYQHELRRRECAREDLNLHDLAATRRSTVRVYQFRHERMEPLPRIERGPAAYEAAALAD